MMKNCVVHLKGHGVVPVDADVHMKPVAHKGHVVNTGGHRIARNMIPV